MSICGTRRFQTVFAQVRFEFLVNFFKLIMLTALILKLHQLLHVVIMVEMFNTELMVLRQILRGYKLLVYSFDHHFGLEVDFGAALLLTLIDELALIFVLWKAAVSEPRIDQLLLD